MISEVFFWGLFFFLFLFFRTQTTQEERKEKNELQHYICMYVRLGEEGARTATKVFLFYTHIRYVYK